jgi:hypothetical protein
VPVYQKINGVWTPATRVYVNRSGVQTLAKAAYVRRSGAWVQAFDYDVLPPNPPEISLELVTDQSIGAFGAVTFTRYINVGVRLPGGSNDPDARLTRVLTDYNGAAPTTQFGGTYTSASDSTYPTEPWSEWRYNSYGPHNDTSVYKYKAWPRNAGTGTFLAGDKTYHFTGWSLDNSGNWSVANAASITIPKGGVADNTVTKEARFQPNSSGSWKPSTTGFVSGDLTQSKSPRSMGIWIYGNQITDSVGGTASIKSAQIYVHRTADDTGQASSNVYLFWTDVGSAGAMPAPNTTNIAKNDATKLGVLAKGQSKWFDIPTSFHAHMNSDIKAIGLDWKDPVKADAMPDDYSVITGTATNLRSGELHVVWEETP